MKNYVGIPSPGDIVKIEGKVFFNDIPKEVKVIKSYINFERKPNDYSVEIDESDKFSGEKKMNTRIGVGYIDEIIKHSGNINRPLNIYRNEFPKQYPEEIYNKETNFESLICNAVENSSQFVTRHIDFEKAFYLYEKNGIGLSNKISYIFCGEGITKWKITNKKKFYKWVDRNLSKILYNKKGNDFFLKSGFYEWIE